MIVRLDHQRNVCLPRGVYGPQLLLGVGSNVKPRHLLDSDRAPFFGILMMIP